MNDRSQMIDSRHLENEQLSALVDARVGAGGRSKV